MKKILVFLSIIVLISAFSTICFASPFPTPIGDSSISIVDLGQSQEQ